MTLVAGIDALDVPSLFAGARRRIILHAAVYGRMACSPPFRRGLEAALARPGFRRLDAVALAPGERHGWMRPFLKALRCNISRQSLDEEIAASWRLLHGLAARHPGRVRLHEARLLPCLPVLVADDAIAFGQYAHASVHAPEGFWTLIRADVETLLDWARAGKPPAWATAEERAAFRLVNECVRAMGPAERFGEQRHVA